MPKRDAVTRARLRLTAAAERLDDAPTQVTVLGGGVLVAVGLHLAADDPRMAWLVAPLALLAGLSVPLRMAIGLGLAAGLAHLAVDVATGADAGDGVGIVARTAVLPLLALMGAVGADVERQRHVALERAASEEPVTGLPNVRVFYEALSAHRRADEPFTILLADLRGMRDLNERYGHPTGTEAMRVLAHVLRRTAGDDAMLARLGSDEIAVVVPGRDEERCRHIIDTSVRRLADEQVRLPDGANFAVHASYGIAVFPDDGEDEVAVLRAADRVKDRAKGHGLDPVGVAGEAGGEPTDACLEDVDDE